MGSEDCTVRKGLHVRQELSTALTLPETCLDRIELTEDGDYLGTQGETHPFKGQTHCFPPSHYHVFVKLVLGRSYLLYLRQQSQTNEHSSDIRKSQTAPNAPQTLNDSLVAESTLKTSNVVFGSNGERVLPYLFQQLGSLLLQRLTPNLRNSLRQLCHGQLAVKQHRQLYALLRLRPIHPRYLNLHHRLKKNHVPDATNGLRILPLPLSIDPGKEGLQQAQLEKVTHLLRDAPADETPVQMPEDESQDLIDVDNPQQLFPAQGRPQQLSQLELDTVTVELALADLHLALIDQFGIGRHNCTDSIEDVFRPSAYLLQHLTATVHRYLSEILTVNRSPLARNLLKTVLNYPIDLHLTPVPHNLPQSLLELPTIQTHSLQLTLRKYPQIIDVVEEQRVKTGRKRGTPLLFPIRLLQFSKFLRVPTTLSLHRGNHRTIPQRSPQSQQLRYLLRLPQPFPRLDFSDSRKQTLNLIPIDLNLISTLPNKFNLSRWLLPRYLTEKPTFLPRPLIDIAQSVQSVVIERQTPPRHKLLHRQHNLLLVLLNLLATLLPPYLRVIGQTLRMQHNHRFPTPLRDSSVNLGLVAQVQERVVAFKEVPYLLLSALPHLVKGFKLSQRPQELRPPQRIQIHIDLRIHPLEILQISLVYANVPLHLINLRRRHTHKTERVNSPSILPYHTTHAHIHQPTLRLLQLPPLTLHLLNLVTHQTETVINHLVLKILPLADRIAACQRTHHRLHLLQLEQHQVMDLNQTLMPDLRSQPLQTTIKRILPPKNTTQRHPPLQQTHSLTQVMHPLLYSGHSSFQLVPHFQRRFGKLYPHGPPVVICQVGSLEVTLHLLLQQLGTPQLQVQLLQMLVEELTQIHMGRLVLPRVTAQQVQTVQLHPCTLQTLLSSSRIDITTLVEVKYVGKQQLRICYQLLGPATLDTPLATIGLEVLRVGVMAGHVPLPLLEYLDPLLRGVHSDRQLNRQQ